MATPSNTNPEHLDNKQNTDISNNDRKKKTKDEIIELEFLPNSAVEEHEGDKHTSTVTAKKVNDLIKIEKIETSSSQLLTVTDSITISTTPAQASIEAYTPGETSFSYPTTLTTDDNSNISGRTSLIYRKDALDSSIDHHNETEEEKKKRSSDISSFESQKESTYAIQDSSSLAIWTDCYVDKIYTIGCFDLFHEGHRILLQRMRQLGREVIVGVHDSRSIYKLKSRVPVDGAETRMLNVKRYADQVYCVAGTDPSVFLTCIVHLRQNETALYVRGDDMIDFPARHVVENFMPVKLLPYTNNVSSTSLRQKFFSHITAHDKEHLDRIN